MAHTYVITSVSYPNNAADPMVTIQGTVDGTVVTVSAWFSVYQSHAASAVSFQNWVAPLMLAAFQALGSTSAVPPSSSFSQ
jgi:hypothetical protein